MSTSEDNEVIWNKSEKQKTEVQLFPAKQRI